MKPEDNSPAPEADEDEDDRAFAEAAAARDKAMAPAEEPEPEPETEAETDGEPEGEGEAAPPADDKPAPAQPKDPWADAPDHLRAAHQAALQELEQKARSANGRYAAAERRLQELERQKVTSQPPAPKGPPLEDQLASLREEYPEIAGPIAALFDRLEAVRKNEEGRERAALQANADRFLQEVPDAGEIVASPAFQAWIEADAPVRLRRAYERNSEAFIDPDGALEVLREFKRVTGATPAPREPDRNPQPDDRRQRQLRAGTAPLPRGGRPSVSGIPDEVDDEEAHWNDLVRQREASRRA